MPDAVHLSDVIDISRVRLHLVGDDKPEVLHDLVGTLGFDAQGQAAILRILLRRESMGSTSIGRGIAVPHCRTPLAKRLHVAYGRRLGGIPYDAIDGVPVEHFFLLVAPPVEVSNEYLPTLGRIAQFAKKPDTTARLTTLQTPEDFLHLLAEQTI